MLRLHRAALHLRRAVAALRGTDFAWHDSPDGVLELGRGPGFRCVVDLSGTPMPVDGDPLLAGSPLDAGRLAPETAAWYGRR